MVTYYFISLFNSFYILFFLTLSCPRCSSRQFFYFHNNSSILQDAGTTYFIINRLYIHAFPLYYIFLINYLLPLSVVLSLFFINSPFLLSYTYFSLIFIGTYLSSLQLQTILHFSTPTF